jgi:hypothetical protein
MILSTGVGIADLRVSNRKEEPELQGNRIKFAIVSLQISAILTLLVAVFLLSFVRESNSAFHGLVTGVGLLLVALPILLAYGLKRRKRWAWNGSLALFVLYLVGGYLPLGIIGLWGLLDIESRREFGVSQARLLNI